MQEESGSTVRNDCCNAEFFCAVGGCELDNFSSSLFRKQTRDKLQEILPFQVLCVTLGKATHNKRLNQGKETRLNQGKENHRNSKACESKTLIEAPANG